MGPLSDGKDAVGASCASTLPWRLPRCRRGGGSRPEGGVENFMAQHAAARAARGTVGLEGDGLELRELGRAAARVLGAAPTERAR